MWGKCSIFAVDYEKDSSHHIGNDGVAGCQRPGTVPRQASCATRYVAGGQRLHRLTKGAAYPVGFLATAE